MVGVGRFARPLPDGGLEFDWEAVKDAIKVHPRAILFWDQLGLLPPDRAHVLTRARADVRELEQRTTAAAAAFGNHRGRTSNFGV